jgi:predicted small metal-binding protein
LIKFYKYHKLTDQERFEKAADELQELMKKTANHPKFKKSLEEQLKDV